MKGIGRRFVYILRSKTDHPAITLESLRISMNVSAGTAGWSVSPQRAVLIVTTAIDALLKTAPTSYRCGRL